MKALWARLHLAGSKDTKERDSLKNAQRGSLPQWPPQPPGTPEKPPISPEPTPSFKPLPDIAPKQVQDQLQHRTQPEPASAPEAKPEPAQEPVSPPASPEPVRMSRTNGSQYSEGKKVAFKSPPTPSQSPTPHQKQSVSRANNRASSSSSKVDVSSKSSSRPTATIRNTQSPYLQSQKDVGSSQSLRSGTPYSQMSAQTSGSRILAATSWSEVTETDLVSNLGSRERTRQEVLFEIISSEQRYVDELIKMKDTFIDPLLHPFSSSTATSPLSSTPNLDYDYYRSESPQASSDQLPPIAARFMSPSPALGPPPEQSSKDAQNIDAESILTEEEDEIGDTVGHGIGSSTRKNAATSQAAKMNHPRSPYRGTPTKGATTRTGAGPVPFPSRSHHSLPPPPRAQMTASTHSLGRQSSVVERHGERERNYSQGNASVADRKSSSPAKGNILRKVKKSTTANEDVFGIGAVAPHSLPEDIRICLEVVDSGVLEGHKRLSEALKKRYDDQFPLVRSLADVFVANSDIFHGYATYVLHLERALEQVDDALSKVSNKKPKNQDAAEYQKMRAFLRKLEENAAEKGETGLAITLSKPFQRLLKYPLLFQNLLFHTDPSTFEYESTLQMVAEVETIVRSIEDEKIQKEERDKTRDVFARIEGLDKVRQLALPKSSRVLVEERQCAPALSQMANAKSGSSPIMINGKNVKGKSSFKRLSDVLHSNSGVGGKKDLWLVVFNDVVLQCQRTGTTSLPLVSTTAGSNSRTTSMPELPGGSKSKYATTGRRNSHMKPRNLYKFLKIETWAIGDVIQPGQGVVSMEDVARTRSQAPGQPRIVPMPDDDEDEGADSDDSDKKSKMSFSYWGADKVTVQKPIIKGRIVPVARRGGGAASYGRESSANAKFGTRLVGNEAMPAPRPASRRTQAVVPSTRRGHTEDSSTSPNYAKATVTSTRPDWNTSTRSPAASSNPNVSTPAARRRNLSQTSAAATKTPTSKAMASPAPSQDSGVGLRR